MRRSLAAFVLVSVSLFACSKKSDAPAPAVQSTTDPTPVAVSTTAAPSGGGVLQPGETLAGRFGREAQSRPNVHPNADDVFTKLGKVGITVVDPKQSLGATYKAAYCTSGYTADELISVMVCEYGSEDAANAGAAVSKSLFPTLETRDVVVHANNTLTTIRQKPTEAAKAEQKKATAAFVAT